MGGLSNSLAGGKRNTGGDGLSEISRIEELEKKYGIEILETLHVISSVGKHGGRGPLKSEHIPRYLAIGEQNLTSARYKFIQESVRTHIRQLTSEKMVSLDPELRSLLGDSEENQVERIVQERSSRRLPLRNLVFYVFDSLFPERPRWRTLTSTDSPLQSMLLGIPDPRAVCQDNGLYVKILIGATVFTGLLQTRDQTETEQLRSKFFDQAAPFEREGIVTIRALKIPIKPISLFPANTAAGQIDYQHRLVASARYFERFGPDARESLGSWYRDYLSEQRAIVQHIPDLDILLGGMMLGKRVVIIYDPNAELLSVSEFISSDRSDTIDVRIESIVSFDELERRKDDLSRRSLLRETRFAAREHRLYLRWGHPYLKALEEIQLGVREVNSQLGAPYYDATLATVESLERWIKSGISELRSLAERLHLQREFALWLGPLHAYVAYSLDDPRPNWVRDGIIVQRFYAAESDRISVRCVPATPDRKGDAVFDQAFPAIDESTHAFFETSSSLVFYLGPIVGDPYSVI